MSIADRYNWKSTQLSDPGVGGFAVTPSNDDDLQQMSRALYIGTGGDIAVKTRDGDTLTFKNLGDGSILPLRCKRVLATGTTATDVIALV